MSENNLQKYFARFKGKQQPQNIFWRFLGYNCEEN